MPYSQAQKLGHATQPGGAGDYHSQTNPSMPGKTVCPYEEHVVRDPNVSRIMLMIMLDFANREALYSSAGDERTMFRCPIMKCYEEFDQPMGLVHHLSECERLKFGEFNCLPCKSWHRYPITERGWHEWESWNAEAPVTGIKQRVSEISDSFFRAIRSQRRSNDPSSHGGSPSAALKSPGPPDWMWSETGQPTLYEEMRFGPMPDQEKPEYTVGSCELRDTFSTSSELLETPPPRYRQSSSGSFASGQTSSSRSGSSSQPVSDTSWGSSTSSLGSPQATAPEVLIPPNTIPVLYLDDLTQSPEGMGLDQAGGQPVWGPTHTPGYADEAALRTNTFLPTPDSQGIAAGCFPIPPINGPLANHQSNSWNPQDDSQFSCLQQQMPPLPPGPPQELHPGFIDLLQDTPAANSGSLDPCQEISSRKTIYELSGQALSYELSGQALAYELSGSQRLVYELCDPQMPVDEILRRHSPFHEGRRSDYTCEICAWQPEKDGKPANFASYLRKHKQTHSGIKFPCPNAGCKRSYSRADNLSKHIKDAHPGSTGTSGPLSSCQTRSANKRRLTNSSTR